MTKVERDDVQVEAVQFAVATEDGTLVEAASRGCLAPGGLARAWLPGCGENSALFTSLR